MWSGCARGVCLRKPTSLPKTQICEALVSLVLHNIYVITIGKKNGYHNWEKIRDAAKRPLQAAKNGLRFQHASWVPCGMGLDCNIRTLPSLPSVRECGGTALFLINVLIPETSRSVQRSPLRPGAAVLCQLDFLSRSRRFR